MQEYYTIITNRGLEKESQLNETQKLKLTELSIGDGNGFAYNPTGSETSLRNERFRTNINKIYVDLDNKSQLIIETIIASNIGGFTIREVGIYDSDGDLFAIGKYPQTFKPVIESGATKDLYIRMILKFSNQVNVEMIVNPNVVMVSVAEVQEIVENNVKEKLSHNVSCFIGAFMYGIRADTPDGWLRCDGADYPSNVFSSFINNYIKTGKIPYKNLADWNTEYNASNGNCGFFGYQEEILDEENLDENGNPTVIQAGILKTPCLQDRIFIAQAIYSENICKYNQDKLQGHSHDVPIGSWGVTNGGSSVYSRNNPNTFNLQANDIISNGVNGDPRIGNYTQPRHIQFPLFVCVSNQSVPVSESQYNGFIEHSVNKTNKSGDNAIFDNMSLIAKRSISKNLSANLSLPKTVIPRNIVFEATTDGWLYCRLGTQSSYVPIVQQSDNISMTPAIEIAYAGIPTSTSSIITNWVFIPKGKFIRWIGGLDITEISFYKCLGEN